MKRLLSETLEAYDDFGADAPWFLRSLTDDARELERKLESAERKLTALSQLAAKWANADKEALAFVLAQMMAAIIGTGEHAQRLEENERLRVEFDDALDAWDEVDVLSRLRDAMKTKP